MADEQERGAPIAYTALAEGTRVATTDGRELGTVRAVRADEGTDIFDGLVIDTPAGQRFVDAPEVAEIYERLVVVEVPGDAGTLPEPEPGPAVVDVDPDTLAGDDEGAAKGAARRVWDRLSGNS